MKKVIITATFTGTDGSCGYKSGMRYVLDVTQLKGYYVVGVHQADTTTEEVKYGSIFALLANWNNIDVVEHTTIIRELTFGEKAAGISFNPGGHEGVNVIKRRFADVIDFANDERLGLKGEAARYHSKGISHAEDSQMNIVKAITWNG